MDVRQQNNQSNIRQPKKIRKEITCLVPPPEDGALLKGGCLVKITHSKVKKTFPDYRNVQPSDRHKRLNFLF